MLSTCGARLDVGPPQVAQAGGLSVVVSVRTEVAIRASKLYR